MRMATKRIAIRRVVAVVFFAVLVGLGAYGWMTARGYEADLAVQPVSMAVDLSRIGATEANYVQSTPLPHGEGVWLDLPVGVESADGFEGELAILDSAKTVQARCEVHSKEAKGQSSRIGAFPPLAKGHYTARFEVIKPVESLAGTAQQLRVEHELCGLEMMPIAIMKLFAMGSGAIAVVIGGFTGVGLARHGWWRS